MHSRVLEEIKAMSQNSDPASQEKFQLQTTAARKVYGGLTSEEKPLIRRKTENPVKALNPPEIQQRSAPPPFGQLLQMTGGIRRATDKAAGIVTRWSDAQWRDIGLFSLTCHAYLDKD